jgi:GxxExxY protein
MATTADGALADRQTYAIIGAAIEVHQELGCGFLERVYREPFAIELAARRIPFEREKKYRVIYKGRPLAATYMVDFVCYGQVLVEIKALGTIGPLEHAQAINYLRVSGLRRALLLNFGARSLQFKRILCDPEALGRRRRPGRINPATLLRADVSHESNAVDVREQPDESDVNDGPA